MESAAPKELCARVLEDQPGAAEEFFETCYPVVRRFLASRCADGRSHNEAEEITEEIFASCFREPGRRNPLRRYSGRIPLDQWLCTIAWNRLKNWWKSGRFTYEQPGANDDRIRPARADLRPAEPPDHDACDLLSDALLQAARGIKPQDLAFLRAYYLQEQTQAEIAQRWNLSPPTVSRSLKRTVARIRSGVDDYLASRDAGYSITWDDLLQAITVAPEILVGFDSRRLRGSD